VLIANDIHLDFFYSRNIHSFPTFDHHVAEAQKLGIISDSKNSGENFCFNLLSQSKLMHEYMLISPQDDEHRILGAMAHPVVLAYEHNKDFFQEMMNICVIPAHSLGNHTTS